MLVDKMKRRFISWISCVVLGTVQESGNCTLAWELLVLWSGYRSLDPFFIAHLFWSGICLRLQALWEEKNPRLVVLLQRPGPYHYPVTETISQIMFNYLSTIEALPLTFNTFPSTYVYPAFVLHDGQQISPKLACGCSYCTNTKESCLRVILFRLTSTSDVLRERHFGCGLYVKRRTIIVSTGSGRVTTGWTVRGSIPGGGEIFRTCPDWPWGPPGLLYNGYRVFPGCKARQVHAADHSPPPSAVVMEE
jgi:hypothetical protein